MSEEVNIFEYPCMDDREIKFIESFLSKDKDFLEFGSGGSTFYFADKVKNLISIEHDEYWCSQMTQKLNEKQVKNAEILFAAPTSQWVSSEFPWNFRSVEFNSYIKAPEYIRRNFPDFKFDVVLLDGRARVECAKFIYPYLTDDAVVIMHDYIDRHRYYAILDWYEEIDSVKTGKSALAVKRKNSEHIMNKFFKGFPDEIFTD